MLMDAINALTVVLYFENFKSKHNAVCILIRARRVSLRNLCSTLQCLDESLSDLEEVISPLFANVTINTWGSVHKTSKTPERNLEKAYQESTTNVLRMQKKNPLCQKNHGWIAQKDQVTKTLWKSLPEFWSQPIVCYFHMYTCARVAFWFRFKLVLVTGGYAAAWVRSSPPHPMFFSVLSQPWLGAPKGSSDQWSIWQKAGDGIFLINW